MYTGIRRSLQMTKLCCLPTTQRSKEEPPPLAGPSRVKATNRRTHPPPCCSWPMLSTNSSPLPLPHLCALPHLCTLPRPPCLQTPVGSGRPQPAASCGADQLQTAVKLACLHTCTKSNRAADLSWPFRLFHPP